jgi:hypothetical protein
MTGQEYKSQAARDAQTMSYGGESYWYYLDQEAQGLYDHFMARGEKEQAESMLTRSLSEALRGNDGE